MEAEASFTSYYNNFYKIYSFEISQTNEFTIINSIKIFFDISSNVYKDISNNYRIKTTSSGTKGARNISLQNIINFINSSPLKFQGYKKISYIKFLKELKQNKLN